MFEENVTSSPRDFMIRKKIIAETKDSTYVLDGKDNIKCAMSQIRKLL